jgi:hypothetical protein
MHPAVHGVYRERRAFQDRFWPVLPGNDIGINLAVTLLTRHKHHCVTVKNPLTKRVDNRSSLTWQSLVADAPGSATDEVDADWPDSPWPAIGGAFAPFAAFLPLVCALVFGSM